MLKLLGLFAQDESGVTSIEYGLIASFIAMVIVGGVTIVGTSLSAAFNNVAAKV
jgi:pilus assembly protein Flp/PilA